MRLSEKTPLITKDLEFGEVIAELAAIGRFNEFVESQDSRYYYYDKWKYKAQEWNIDPKKLWGTVKRYRGITNKDFTISQIPGFKFKIGTPSFVQKYLHEFDMNLGGSLQGDTIIPSEDRDRYLISSLMEEAIASSQLEGAATTRQIAREMLESNRRPKNHAEKMILNNYEAMKWIVSNKDTPITITAIRQLHAILTKSTLADPQEEGAYRKDDDVKVIGVQTGTPVYTPPKAAHLDQLMNDFCSFASEQKKVSFFLHPIAKGIILHFLIGYIHPFVDGNGRTARTIFYWYLLKHGYWLIEFMSVSRIILNSKAQYSRAYLHTEQDENDLTYFLVYNLRTTHLALEDLKRYIQRKSAEKQNAMTLLRNTSLNDRQIVIVQEIIQDSTIYFTVKQIENKFGISNQTARNDLNGLVAEGIFVERRIGKKSQYLPVKGFIKKIMG
jgi:Fic family protein